MQSYQMACPRCEQGWVFAALIKSRSQQIWICQECEAVWFDPGAVTHPGNWIDYTTYMESIGLTPLWSELELVPAHLN